MATTDMTVRFTPNDKGTPPGKLADAELHFTDGPLNGLKLIGFSIWERRTGAGRNVTFPARQYAVNGERRSFALLRPVTDTAAQDRIRDRIRMRPGQGSAGVGATDADRAERQRRARGRSAVRARGGSAGRA